MKFIYTDVINTIEVSPAANANFPITRVQDDYVGRKYKAQAAVDTATITIGTIGSADTIAIIGTNAQSANLLIQDPNQIDWGDSTEWEDGTEWTYQEADITGSLFQQRGLTSSALWGEFEEIDYAANVSVTLAAATGQTLECGIIRVGKRAEFEDPQYGLQEYLIDYSYKRKLSNGSKYYKLRNIARGFEGQLFAGIDDDFYTFMYTIARTFGETPLAIKITDRTGNDWIIFGSFDGLPKGVHAQPIMSNIQFNIEEAL